MNSETRPLYKELLDILAFPPTFNNDTTETGMTPNGKDLCTMHLQTTMHLYYTYIVLTKYSVGMIIDLITWVNWWNEAVAKVSNNILFNVDITHDDAMLKRNKTTGSANEAYKHILGKTLKYVSKNMLRL